MCVCVYKIYVCAYVCLCMYVYIYVWVCVCLCICVSVYIYVSECVYVCTSVSVSMDVYVCVCVYFCVCVQTQIFYLYLRKKYFLSKDLHFWVITSFYPSSAITLDFIQWWGYTSGDLENMVSHSIGIVAKFKIILPNC